MLNNASSKRPASITLKCHAMAGSDRREGRPCRPGRRRAILRGQCPQQAAGIAYRVLFSIAPLAIVLVSIFGLVLQDDSVRQDVVNTIVDALPVSAAGRHDVERRGHGNRHTGERRRARELARVRLGGERHDDRDSAGTRARDGGHRDAAAGAREARRPSA